MSTVQATNLKHGSSASNNIVLDASGNTTISGAATISGNAVVTGTLQANGVTGSVYPLVLGTAQATTSGTAIDFTGIPSWVRRVTVMLNNVSTNASGNLLIQLGAGSITTSGYVSSGNYLAGGVGSAGLTSTAGIVLFAGATSNFQTGHVVFTLLTGNTWIASGVTAFDAQVLNGFTAGRIALSGALDRVRLTTTTGTDVFDAGSINIMWE